LSYCKIKKCDGKSVTDKTDRQTDVQTDRQTDKRRRSDPLVSPLLTADATKTILTLQETQIVNFGSVPFPLSLKFVKLLRNLLFSKFSVSNKLLPRKHNSTHRLVVTSATQFLHSVKECFKVVRMWLYFLYFNISILLKWQSLCMNFNKIYRLVFEKIDFL